MNEQALAAFIKGRLESERLVNLIAEHIQGHYGVSPNEVEWGHVGTVEEANKVLTELVRFLNIQ